MSTLTPRLHPESRTVESSQAGAPALAKLHLRIGGMACSFCVASIAKAVGRMPGVQEVNVNLAHEEALVEYDPARVAPAQIERTLRELGYTLRDPKRLRAFEEEEAELAAQRGNLFFAAGFALAAFAAMTAMWMEWLPPRAVAALYWLLPVLALSTVFGPGWHILEMAWASLRRGILNQHVLMEFGAFAGLAGGFLGYVYPSFPYMDFFAVAVFVTAYHILSGYVSALVRTRSSQAVRRLLALAPPTARVVRDGAETVVPVEEVRPGELVRVRPGESLPLDGEIVEGFSAVDESLVSGEPIPAEKKPGDEVIGGSINQYGTLLMRVTRIGAESFLNRVARQVEEARALKPGLLLLVDRILQVYVPAVLAVAGAAVLVWTLGARFVAGEADWLRATFAGLAVLVMGYPCALGMATPLAMIRGGGLAAERGVLLRSAQAFQAFKDVRRVVLDKTGTLTRGAPAVRGLLALNGFDESQALRLAAAAEAASEHPLARAVTAHAQERGLALPAVEAFQAVPGKGVEARIEGRAVLVGTLRFLVERGVDDAAARERVEKLQAAGDTVIALAVDGRLAALVAIADPVKPDAREAVLRLREAGLVPIMLTGDNARTARAVAAAVGIDEVHAEVLPPDKAEIVRALQKQGHRVAMVGDGINDAPALMQADVGVAIGAGTDIAIESADVVLIGKRLGAVVDAWHISRESYRKTVQNLALAFSFNGIGVPLAATGLVHPVWAMAAMAASVTAVLTNSFGARLLPRRRRVREITLTVANMHCEACVGTIRDGVLALPGVVRVDGDVGRRTVTVAYRAGAIAEAEIRAAIAARGYEPSPAE